MSDTTPVGVPDLSIAGFYPQPGSDRATTHFNVGWRFRKGAANGAEQTSFNDSDWAVVNLPHGLEILPLEASGGVNYQGEAWYRKRFHIEPDQEEKRTVLYFEGLMGKSRIWINGQLLKNHYGGFLPVVVDITDTIIPGQENVVSVWVDNSDDPSYPPGKPQGTLDFAYFGGIYRNVWMVTTNKIHVTDPNEVDVVAGGGVFVHYRDVSTDSATVMAETHIANGLGTDARVSLELCLMDPDGNEVAASQADQTLPSGEAERLRQELVVPQPRLWHVDAPNLYDLVLLVKDDEGRALDAVRLRIGIRSIEFRGKEGFFLNGQPFDGKLIGSNRHQDYAYVGNALSNGAHWRDAVLHRQAGMRVIRCAHYPQDPAFMDACDALGLFVIITTPGWQFWNDDPVFEERVYADIRDMVRRDRNRPSVWLWEPILNETNYPGHFAQKVHDITHEEYPHPGCYTACDREAAGQEHFDVVYSHPFFSWVELPENNEENRDRLRFDYSSEERCVFTREWGDCVDNWRTQSSPSRIPKHWGEQAQLVQAKHYADPDYVYSCYESLYSAPAQHVGGTLWHGIDHQRGYHADTFWGGILDATRQPKFSYQMFRSQVPSDLDVPGVPTGPFVFIAHLLHPTSPKDVTVFSNCEEVRLTYNGKEIGTLPTGGHHMPHYPVVFKDVYRHIHEERLLKAEGINGGKVVVTAEQRSWDRCKEWTLEAGLCGVSLQADGGDFVPVVARIVDKNGVVVRLTDDTVRFTVSGPATLIDSATEAINPQKLCWGEAVILVRAGTEPGTITVRAESARPGICKPLAAELKLVSVRPTESLTFQERAACHATSATMKEETITLKTLKDELDAAKAELLALKLAEVEQQQEDCM